MQQNNLPKLKFNKKLQLNKEDIVRLDEEQMKKIAGGGEGFENPDEGDSTECTTNGSACSCSKKSCTN